MKILGIDPGSVIIGWCLASDDDGKPSVLEFGHLKSQKKDKALKRLGILFKALSEVVETHKPDHIIMETIIPVSPSRQAMIHLGKSAGIIIAAASAAGCSLSEINVMTARKLVMDDGRAKKDKIKTYFSEAFGLNIEQEPDDTSDAILLALAGFSASGLPTPVLSTSSLPPLPA